MRHLLLTILMIGSLGLLYADTNVSGTIAVDSTWVVAGSPYIVQGNLTIGAGVTLTIEPDVIVRFNTNVNMLVRGRLIADQVQFTTNILPETPGSWRNIQIGDASYSGFAQLTDCIVRYGGVSNVNANEGMVYIYRGEAVLNRCALSFSRNSGIRMLATAKLTLTETNIFSSDWPLTYSGSADVTVKGASDFSGNTHDAFYMRYYNTGTSLTLDTLNVPYYFGANFTIDADDTLKIFPGAILKFNSGARLIVNGALQAQGESGNKIYFTAYTNDNLGGDTNGDASASAPASRYWDGVVFQDPSTDDACIMEFCDLSFAGSGNVGAVTMVNASPTIDHCEMYNNYYGAMIQNVSNPVFTNNTIGSSEVVPIAMSFDAHPVFLNNVFSFSDNTYDAIGIIAGTLQGDANLPIRSVTGVPNVTYLLLGTVTVPQSLTLNISPGVVIKSYSISHRLVINGKMDARGTADVDSMITFTSVKDDNFGNPSDTNRDGSQSTPGVSDWGGIIFESTSDTSSILQYCLIKYGQASSYYYNGRYISGGVITTLNASPNIRNCDINNVNYAIYAYQSSNPKIINNNFSNTARMAVAMSVSANPVFSGNTFNNTGWTALGIIGGNLGTNGSLIKRTVAGFENITYVLLEDLTIDSGTEVTVQPGVVIKFYSGAGIFVDGGFRAQGTITDGKIVFTSMYDDNVGNPGDTENNGNATVPNSQNWETIHFRGTADDGFNLIDMCEIKYNGSGSWGVISFTDAGGTVSNTLLSDSYNYGIRCAGTSSPSIDNVIIQNCRLDPIAMSLKSEPEFANMTIRGMGNGTYGIRILEGTLASDDTLSISNIGGADPIAYIVHQLTINAGVVFTIDPGVVIKFLQTDSYIRVNGALIAEGTQGNKIYFTSLKDDSKGGDTNEDGVVATPAWGDWWGLVFYNSDLDHLNSLKYCQFYYGGRDQNGWNDLKDYGTIRVFDATVTMDSCAVEFSHTSAVGVFNSADPVFRNNRFFNIRLTPLTISMFSNPTFSNNVISNVSIFAIGLANENYTQDATIQRRDIAGYTNMTYYLYTQLNINSGTTITVSDGVVFKYNNNGGFNVAGSMVTNGTEAAPVVITHEYDDDYGNPKDTNNNGAGSTPTISSSYYALSFEDISDDAVSHLNHTILRYAHAGVNLNSAAPVIENCLFDHNNWGVVLRGVSTPALRNNIFNDLTNSGMIISLVSYPRETTGNLISGATYRSIGILEEELVQDVTLQKRDFGGISNIAYHFSGNYTIGTSVVLTIEPGIVLKFHRYRYMTVRRGLIAEGGATADSMIVFTHIADDFYGGDTNADSTISIPSYTLGWSGIRFVDQAEDASCRIKYCIFRYAGNYSTDAAIIATSASPTISYSVLRDNRNGLIASSASNPTINNSDIYNNATYGINNVDKQFLINAENNWWGSNNGPTHSGNPGGTGDAVTDGVDYNPILTSGALNPLMGDVSLNGVVQAYDAAQVLQEVVAPGALNERQARVADVSAEGGISAYDAALILQYTVGLIPGFPAEAVGDKTPADPVIEPILLAKQVNDIHLNLGNAEAKAGAEVRVPVSLKNAHGTYAIEVVLEYDVEKLSINNIQTNELSAKMNVAFKEDAEKGTLRIAMASAEDLKEDGEIASIIFKVSEKIKGETELPIRVSEFAVNEVDFSDLVQSGSVKVSGTPVSYQLYQNYPNPFNGTTVIKYQVPDNGIHVKMEIYNIMGQKVATLYDGMQDAGSYEVTWNGTNALGVPVASGVYFYRMQTKDFSSLKKFHLLK